MGPVLFSGDIFAFLRRHAAALPALHMSPYSASLPFSVHITSSHFSPVHHSTSFACSSSGSSFVISPSASSILSTRLSRRCLPYVKAFSSHSAAHQFGTICRFRFLGKMVDNSLFLSAGEATSRHICIWHGRTPSVCLSCARLRGSWRGCEIGTCFCSGFASSSKRSNDEQEHQKLNTSPVAESGASSSSTATPRVYPSNAADRASFPVPGDSPQGTLPCPDVSSVGPVGNSPCLPSQVTAVATPPPSSSSFLVGANAVPRPAASDSAPPSAAISRVASSSGAPTPESGTLAAAKATPHGPRLHRLVLPPTLPTLLKESGEGKAAIAAAMERALEGRAADQPKMATGRKLSGNDHMRMVVPRERKKRTKHTGGQNATY